jgi:hypothetical protein
MGRPDCLIAGPLGEVNKTRFEIIQRQVDAGVGPLSVRSIHPSKPSPKDQNLDLGRWGLGQVMGFCSILALASVPTSVVIGSFLGGADGVLVALIISGTFVLLFGSIAVALVALGSIFDAVRGMGRQTSRPSNLGSGGVSDGWLDGPA